MFDKKKRKTINKKEIKMNACVENIFGTSENRAFIDRKTLFEHELPAMRT